MPCLLTSATHLELGFRLGRSGKQVWNGDVQKLRPGKTAVREFG